MGQTQSDQDAGDPMNMGGPIPSGNTPNSQTRNSVRSGNTTGPGGTPSKPVPTGPPGSKATDQYMDGPTPSSLTERVRDLVDAGSAPRPQPTPTQQQQQQQQLQSQQQLSSSPPTAASYQHRGSNETITCTSSNVATHPQSTTSIASPSTNSPISTPLSTITSTSSSISKSPSSNRPVIVLDQEDDDEEMMPKLEKPNQNGL